MKGRLEHQKKFQNNVNAILEMCPGYVREWAENMEAGDKTGSTRTVFVRIIYKFLSSISSRVNEIKLEELTFSKVQSYYISVKTKEDGTPTSDSYQQQIWCCLNNFFSFLLKRKYIEENPMDSITKPKNHDIDRINEHRVLLTEKDFNLILNSVNSGVGSKKAKTRQQRFHNRDLALLLLLMVTGMRKTALTEINIEDFDFTKRTLKVIDKGDKFQLYYLNDDVMQIINNWVEDRKDLGIADNQALFVSYDGKRLSGTAIDKIVAKYCEDALGYKVSPHKLRAGFVSIYYNKTRDIEATRRAVGHSNISTTQRYIVTNNSERKDATNYITNALKF